MPKKAKKGGGGKGGVKTEEERLLLQQQRAQAEEEMAKKKEEILTLFLKDKLQKEERNTAVNLLKLNEVWRSRLRQSRAAELRHDMTVLSQTFERQLDSLNSTTKNEERDLQEAERQSAQVWRVHLQHVERLCSQQDKQQVFVQQQWGNCLLHLSSSLREERRQMLVHSQQHRADLEELTFLVEQQHKTMMTEIHRLYDGRNPSYKSAHTEWVSHRTSSLVQVDEEKLREKTLQKQEAEQLYSSQIQALDNQLSKIQNLIQVADADREKVKRLQDNVLQLNKKLSTSKTKNQSVEQDLTAARNQVNQRTLELRDQMTQAHTAARKQLTDLTVWSDDATKELQAVMAKGEKALRVAEMCRKLEREQQTVLSLLPAEELRQERPGPETQEPAQELPELQQVTWSINVAVLQREALKKQRDDLGRENQQLRLLLRQHLDAMTVSGDALDGRHALLGVYRAPTTAAPPDANRCHTVIEAVHVVKHSL
ncbi:dynein regulatory complex subunit 2 [Enoplosus armatus]|uniref:dynein regulatory complex subunit 2 n=1 Tax=Enoplosus armatus TaxID=215367 RepID=UPI0039925BF0